MAYYPMQSFDRYGSSSYPSTTLFTTTTLMFPSVYASNSYATISPARPIYARNNQSRGGGGASNGILSGILKAVTDFGVGEILNGIFNN